MSAWSSGPCRAVGHHFVLEIEPERGFTDRLAPVVAPFRVRAGAAPVARTTYRVVGDPDGGAALLKDGVPIAAGVDGEAMLPWLVWNLNRAVIAASTAEHVLLHAAGAVRDGVTVVLPADMESGKTTTVAGLLRAGYDYLTDEAVAIRVDDLRIDPFPKALSLDPGSWALFPECRPSVVTATTTQWQAHPEMLGSRVATGPVGPPQLVVFPTYAAGAETRATPLTAGETTREMARMTFGFADAPARNLAVLADVAVGARGVRLEIGDLDRAVGLIDGLVEEIVGEVAWTGSR